MPCVERDVEDGDARSGNRVRGGGVAAPERQLGPHEGGHAGEDQPRDAQGRRDQALVDRPFGEEEARDDEGDSSEPGGALEAHQALPVEGRLRRWGGSGRWRRSGRRPRRRRWWHDRGRRRRRGGHRRGRGGSGRRRWHLGRTIDVLRLHLWNGHGNGRGLRGSRAHDSLGERVEPGLERGDARSGRAEFRLDAACAGDGDEGEDRRQKDQPGEAEAEEHFQDGVPQSDCRASEGKLPLSWEVACDSGRVSS